MDATTCEGIGFPEVCDLLNLSASAVDSLVGRGLIRPLEGSADRFSFTDLMAYRHARREEAERAFSELSAMADEHDF